MKPDHHQSAGAWAKKYHFAARAVIDATLRPYDLGSTQWYVLWHLVRDGQLAQRELLTLLQIEKATLSGVVSTLVRKRFVKQTTDPADQRHKMLSITPAGRALWAKLPDPIDLILRTAFEGVSEDDLATVTRVLSIGTDRLNSLLNKGEKS
ncbi:MAG: MarR family winged helix-turn-helix transcriptional regulator [Candidatus Baltobacteraceae bacterium]